MPAARSQHGRRDRRAQRNFFEKRGVYTHQNSLAATLREAWRLARSTFMLDWLSDIDLQRRAQTGLNKGGGLSRPQACG
ncbi:Tn3 family transposase [Rhizobium mesoamericanum]|uniref:Tn3 transposase DDE domain-containing protein n=1 Tax=Rhizobium mesoamericanum STM3625 TaxID=1211777 RepID=K0PLE9_9HYPH|nr:hypothetical protein BN77_4325 [Rhizobium mesoamericanum STM3625]